jgi:hypothetical protein
MRQLRHRFDSETAAKVRQDMKNSAISAVARAGEKSGATPEI